MAPDLLFRDNLDLLLLRYEVCEEWLMHDAPRLYLFCGDGSGAVVAAGNLVRLSELVLSVTGNVLHCLWRFVVVPAQRR